MHVLWGYHSAYGPEPIKLMGSSEIRGLSKENVVRTKQGFLTYIYKAGDQPTGLRMMVQKLAGQRDPSMEP